ncbi:hypothetical protein J4402_04085 [Candidatus Pacearchaeota archaeon]|nr:hypothetical protein [Candidatus Pacearchaeota archaeon]
MKLNIYEILFWIFFILAIVTVFWYIFGDSPTIEQALLILVISLLFKIQSNVSFNTAEITILKRSFIRMADDFKMARKK